MNQLAKNILTRQGQIQGRVYLYQSLVKSLKAANRIPGSQNRGALLGAISKVRHRILDLLIEQRIDLIKHSMRRAGNDQ